jgi:hypothetical protein
MWNIGMCWWTTTSNQSGGTAATSQELLAIEVAAT